MTTATAKSKLGIDHFYRIWFGKHNGNTLSQIALKNYGDFVFLERNKQLIKTRPNAIETIRGLRFLLNNYQTEALCRANKCENPAEYMQFVRGPSGVYVVGFDHVYCGEHKKAEPYYPTYKIGHDTLLCRESRNDKRRNQEFFNMCAGIRNKNFTEKAAAEITQNLEARLDAEIEKMLTYKDEQEFR